ncbi:MAG: O-antigen ligase family protein, partial [Chitinivibrionales bacterium]|nr:O-antigen ligase family protein [Chitinivibrionales bacterium]
VLFGAACLAFAMPFLIKQSGKSLKNRLHIYGIAVCVCALPLLIWSDNTWQRLAEFTTRPVGAITSVSYRLYFFEAMWKLFLHHPLWGAGLGNLEYLGIPFWPEAFRRIASAFYIVDNGHCEYLQILCELGLVGFLLTMILWIGAVVRGARQVFKSKDNQSYAMLIILIALLLHAGYSIEARRIPTSLLLWSAVGYFWKTPFSMAWQAISPAKRKLSGIVLLAVHCLLFGLFIQIMLGDYFFLKSVNAIKRDETSGSLLVKAIKVCPYNANAFYQLAALSLKTKQYNYALSLADRLDAIAPYFWPTDFVRAYSWYGLGDYGNSLRYANQQIAKKPTMLDSYKIKVRDYAMLDSCKKMESLKDSLLIGMPKLERAYEGYLKSPSQAGLNSNGLLGRVTFAIGAKSIEHNNGFYRHQVMHLLYERLENLRIIKETTCSQPTLQLPARR